MSNKTYDTLKYLAQVVLPAAATLYVALAALWGLPRAEAVSGTIMAVDTFLGALLHIQAGRYTPSTDGTLTLSGDGKNDDLVLKPSAAGKDTLRLSVSR